MRKFLQKVKKYRTELLYCFFGALTTAVNVAVYWVLYYLSGIGNPPATAAAWAVSVAFAFITNKWFVFEGGRRNVTARQTVRQFGSFVLCRILTGAADLLIMFVGVDLLGLAPVLLKILANLIVIVLNYFAGKAVVFRESHADTGFHISSPDDLRNKTGRESGKEVK